MNIDEALQIIDVWLETPFKGGRHARRIEKIKAYEDKVFLSNINNSNGRVVIIDHPLVQHKLGIIRNVETSVKEFRELVEEIAGLMVYEITRHLSLIHI